MDVLRPSLININGRIYRRNIIKEEQYEDEEDFSYMDAPGIADIAEDETCDTHLIEQTDKGYRCAIDVPSVLYKYIIGKKGETRKRLETDTKTSINIPKQGVEGQIVITGSHKAAVLSAVTRVEVLVDSFRRKQPFTHFLSFPLNDPKIQEGFLRFKDDVLLQCSQDNGVDESIFQNPAKLHLTIGTLSLLNEMEVRKAYEHLQECQMFLRDITEGKPLPLEVRGIEYMNDDPAMVDVLYAKVNVTDGSDNLQVIADRLVEHFVSAGLMVREWDKVKLHGTVMNTLFRKDSTAEDTGGQRRQTLNEREAFDARNILKKFAAYPFGEFELNSVLLSQRYSTDCTGYYSSAGSICFS
ncbi:activating signal cointegrator 1 complex subunit 1 [Cynoglossus semilaevis]|uniref:Activating signal cointegrator 1 complex subunit 1 n=1 Tax=Cynoglossus semilaevis TaxID=244447 RepID=A0A3P8WPL8_CYNSE|nr:activating signal cointegrator 1 complex subunit 1 [Cynoglossus semilaevis]XP_008312776.1 activating signal cointegrator 1 complex subunit 1 [Cynoglossus semilaevis]XP_008312777.1 activating signal cointegrator 1 complex subunit 1 [Cynoglossus semilaevis]XP_024913955.1 activating signal cointegrator 1 complex subunit 1 [Cynoglossus semilaevis]XP_024913956.1 activating signal cointegrator 1 complex subunit 1 [Cynoglossus semilaevis]